MYIRNSWPVSKEKSICSHRVSAVDRRSNVLLYSWASLRWAQLIRKPSLMSATLCSTFSVARLSLSSCLTRARPIEQTTVLSCASKSLIDSQKSTAHYKSILFALTPPIDILRRVSGTQWLSLLGATQTSWIRSWRLEDFYVPVERGRRRERERVSERMERG